MFETFDGDAAVEVIESSHTMLLIHRPLHTSHVTNLGRQTRVQVMFPDCHGGLLIIHLNVLT